MRVVVGPRSGLICVFLLIRSGVRVLALSRSRVHLLLRLDTAMRSHRNEVLPPNASSHVNTLREVSMGKESQQESSNTGPLELFPHHRPDVTCGAKKISVCDFCTNTANFTSTTPSEWGFFRTLFKTNTYVIFMKLKHCANGVRFLYNNSDSYKYHTFGWVFLRTLFKK